MSGQIIQGSAPETAKCPHRVQDCGEVSTQHMVALDPNLQRIQQLAAIDRSKDIGGRV